MLAVLRSQQRNAVLYWRALDSGKWQSERSMGDSGV